MWTFLDRNIRLLLAFGLTVLGFAGGGWLMIRVPEHADWVKMTLTAVLSGGGVLVVKNGSGRNGGAANGA